MSKEELSYTAYFDMLKQRYEGKEELPKTVTELTSENPDIPIRKLNKHLRDIGEKKAENYYIRNRIMQGKDTDTMEFDYCMVSLKDTVPDAGGELFAYEAGGDTYVPGDMAVVNFEYRGLALGEVVEVIHCFGIDAPCPVSQSQSLIRKANSEDLSCGHVIVTSEDKKRFPWMASYNVFEMPKAKQRVANKQNKIEFSSDNTVPFVPNENFGKAAIEFDDDTEIVNAVFRGLDCDVNEARKALKSEPTIKTVTLGISEFVLDDKEEIQYILKNFSSLKAAMFVEQWILSKVHMAYSRSGYPHITDAFFVGFCDFHGETRWDMEHLPTESEFAAASTFIQTGEHAKIDYIFVMEKDWGAMNYVVHVNGSTRQLNQTTQPELPEFLVEPCGSNQGIIIAYNGSATNLVLPETYDGMQITGIDLHTKPKKLSKIESITVPEGYQIIGGFANSSSLKKVTLPHSLLTIQAKAFYRCKNLEEVVLHDDLFYIYDEAFAECPKLKTFSLPARLVGGCLEREDGGIDGRVGRWLFRNSGIRELYVNSRDINPFETECLQGCKDYVIYAIPGSPFFNDEVYSKHTQEYRANPLAEFYGVVSQNHIANDGQYLQIDHDENRITNISAFVQTTRNGEREDWIDLSFVVEGNTIKIINRQRVCLGIIQYKRDIGTLMKDNKGRIDNFNLAWTQKQMQEYHESFCTFDIVIDKIQTKKSQPTIHDQKDTRDKENVLLKENTISSATPNVQKASNSISKIFVINRHSSTTRVHIIMPKEANNIKLDWDEVEVVLRQASLNPGGIYDVITFIVSMLSEKCFVIADYNSVISDDVRLASGWLYNCKFLFDDFSMCGNDDGICPTDIDIEDVNTWVNEFIRQRFLVDTAKKYFLPMLEAPYMYGIFSEEDMLNYNAFLKKRKATASKEKQTSHEDEACHLAAEQAEAERKQQEAAAQERALAQVRKAAEEEKKRKDEEARRLAEESAKAEAEAEARRIAEEKAKVEEEMRRAEEARKQKEAEARRAAEEKYSADLRSWEQGCEDIKQQREQAVTDRLSAAKATFEQAAQKDYDTAVSVATDRKKTAQQNKADAELRLSKLGLFKFAEKNAMKEAIAQAESEIAAAEKDLEQAKQTLNTALAGIPTKVSAQESVIRESMEKEFALPPKPAKPNQ